MKSYQNTTNQVIVFKDEKRGQITVPPGATVKLPERLNGLRSYADAGMLAETNGAPAPTERKDVKARRVRKRAPKPVPADAPMPDPDAVTADEGAASEA